MACDPVLHVRLLRDCCTRGLILRQSEPVIDQGLNHNGRHARAFHVERIGSARREIENASASVWTPVVDFDDDGVAVAEVRHLRVRRERQRAMRRGGSHRVEDLATGRLPADKVVPSGFPQQSGSSRAPRPARAGNVIVSIWYGLETCERWFRLFECYCRGTHHCDRTLSGTGTFTGRHCSISWGLTGGLTRVVRCALLFGRPADCAGGCHQTREGNTYQSTH